MNYYLRFTLAYLFAGLFAGTAFADLGQGIATQYEITMLKFELCTDAPLTTEEDVTCTGAVVVGIGLIPGFVSLGGGYVKRESPIEAYRVLLCM